ncbi:MAG: AAA family ATPase [Cyanobacteria bacterium P01_G01_bin.54]
MLKSLRIENFRCFKYFEMPKLGRINLIVGENNSGKTSVLEAIEILANQGSVDFLKEILRRRQESEFEQKQTDSKGRTHVVHNESQPIDLRYLLHQRISEPNCYFYIVGEGSHDSELTKVQLSLEPPQESRADFLGNRYHLKTPNGLFINSSHEIKTIEQSPETQDSIHINGHLHNTQVLTSTSVSLSLAKSLFGKIMFNPEEEELLEAMRIIDKRIQRISPDTTEGSSIFYVKLSDHPHRIPLGSMGDGMWRMLSIALTLVTAKEGFVLIDEIDTGLHYTAMEEMWRFIWQVARKLDVQVFATTHNSDCWQSLAELVDEEDVGEEGITIHRIERGASRSVMFTENQIAIAAENDIEVR